MFSSPLRRDDDFSHHAAKVLRPVAEVVQVGRVEQVPARRDTRCVDQHIGTFTATQRDRAGLVVEIRARPVGVPRPAQDVRTDTHHLHLQPASGRGATFYERGLKRVNPFFLGMMNHNAMIGALADYFDIRGYNTAISAGCSSGNVALANAYHLVALGGADVTVTGGVDTPIYPLTFGLYSASQAMTNRNGDPKKAMCPYDSEDPALFWGKGPGL